MSLVATNESPAPAKGREWTRDDKQEEIVRAYLARIRRQYRNADPELLRLLLDDTILGTDEVVEKMGLKGSTRAFQWYTAGRDLAAADQVPHPAGAPEMDATAGHRGNRIIRGSIAGRWLEWAMGSGKLSWNPNIHEFQRQPYVNSGGAPKTNP